MSAKQSVKDTMYSPVDELPPFLRRPAVEGKEAVATFKPAVEKQQIKTETMPKIIDVSDAEWPDNKNRSRYSKYDVYKTIQVGQAIVDFPTRALAETVRQRLKKIGYTMVMAQFTPTNFGLKRIK